MTIEEVKALLQIGSAYYPSANIQDSKFKTMVSSWHEELKKFEYMPVLEAFKDACKRSPSFFPSLPQVLESLNYLKSQNYKKPEDEEFKDSHCGRTKEEWANYEKWANSDEGKRKIREYQKRINEIFGSEVF